MLCTTNINTFNTIRTLITYQVLKLSECLFVEQHNRSCNSSKHDSSSQRNERNINCTLTDSVMEAPSVVLCEIYTCNYIGPENDYLTCSPGHCVGKLTVSFAVEPAVKFQKSGNKFLPAITDVCLFSFDKPHTHPFNGSFSGTTQVSRYQKCKPIWILLKQETVSGNGISWAICKSAPCSRQITMPAPHHSVFFTGRMPFLS